MILQALVDYYERSDAVPVRAGYVGLWTMNWSSTQAVIALPLKHSAKYGKVRLLLRSALSQLLASRQ